MARRHAMLAATNAGVCAEVAHANCYRPRPPSIASSLEPALHLAEERIDGKSAAAVANKCCGITPSMVESRREVGLAAESALARQLGSFVEPC